MSASSDRRLDAAHAAYQAEFARWCYREAPPSRIRGWEIVRDVSDPDRVEEVEIMRCRGDRANAEAWLGAYRGRAAMQAALDALYARPRKRSRK